MSDGTVVAALLNKGPHTANITVPLSLFGAQWAQRPPGSGAGVEVRDLWAHKDLPAVMGSSYSVAVKSHAAVVYKLQMQ
jgi:hypothetical protein